MVGLDRFLLFWLEQPLEQCTPDEFHKAGGQGKGRWEGPMQAVGSPFFIIHLPPYPGKKIHPSLIANPGANGLTCSAD